MTNDDHDHCPECDQPVTRKGAHKTLTHCLNAAIRRIDMRIERLARTVEGLAARMPK